MKRFGQITWVRPDCRGRHAFSAARFPVEEMEERKSRGAREPQQKQYRQKRMVMQAGLGGGRYLG